MLLGQLIFLSHFRQVICVTRKISIMIILLLLCTGMVVAQNYVTVKTSYGVLQGRRVDYGNDRSQLYYGQADIFLGIPYARAPVGDLRFKRAVDCAPYTQIHDATYYRPKCPQLNAGDYVNEDCLYLNIFTPKAGQAQPGAAVMVFIDGANGFGQGGWDSTTQKGMVRNLVSRGVVCVTLQYRLGALAHCHQPPQHIHDDTTHRWVERICQFVQFDSSVGRMLCEVFDLTILR